MVLRFLFWLCFSLSHERVTGRFSFDDAKVCPPLPLLQPFQTLRGKTRLENHAPAVENPLKRCSQRVEKKQQLHLADCRICAHSIPPKPPSEVVVFFPPLFHRFSTTLQVPSVGAVAPVHNVIHTCSQRPQPATFQPFSLFTMLTKTSQQRSFPSAPPVRFPHFPHPITMNMSFFQRKIKRI